MFKGYIYRHWIINDKGQEKSYIGQTTEDNVEKRWGKNGKGYAPEKEKEPTKFYNAIKKYGWDNFSHKILFIIECETKEELVFWLDEWEKYYIEKYDSFYNGYNSTAGGGNGIRSEETKRKLSEALKGKPSSHKGIPHSEETKRKIGKASSKKIICLETKHAFDSIKQAQEWLGKGNIIQHLKGDAKSAGKHPITGEKLHWMYLDEYEMLTKEKELKN